jgi:SpoIID/LytB domain protein
MSQYGAYAAATSGRGYAEILGFYYPGTRLVTTSISAELRVLLVQGPGELRVRPEAGLTLWWTRENGTIRPGTLPTALAGCRVSTWRVRPVEGRDMTVDGYSCGAWHTYVPAGWLAATGRASFVAPDDNVQVERRLSDGTRVRRGYRGFVRVVLRAGQLQPVNVVSYEAYLRSVVPSESPAGWPDAALRAQAVAARTYAVRSAQGRESSYFDVYNTSASQVYRGMLSYGPSWEVTRRNEDPRSTTAVAETKGEMLEYEGRPALTEFGSSNGGRTAGGGVPYLRAVGDPWDLLSGTTTLSWTDTVSASRLESLYPQIGRLSALRVTERSGGGEWGGRVDAVELVGSEGVQVVRGQDSVRSALGIRSAWFGFTG